MALADRVKAVVAEELGVPESQVIESATFQGDLKADSLMVVELIMTLEDEFGVDIPEEDAQSIETVGDAIRYIERKIGEAG